MTNTTLPAFEDVAKIVGRSAAHKMAQAGLAQSEPVADDVRGARECYIEYLMALGYSEGSAQLKQAREGEADEGPYFKAILNAYRRGAKEAAATAPASTTDEDGFTTVTPGNEPTFPEGTKIRVKLRNGVTTPEFAPPGPFSWDENGEGTIVAYIIKEQATTDEDGFTAHDGTERPVPTTTRVVYKMKGDKPGQFNDRTGTAARNLRWPHLGNDSDITAYKIVS